MILSKVLSAVYLSWDRKAERTNPDIAGRPQVVHGTTQVLFPGCAYCRENTAINIKNKSYSVTADTGARGRRQQVRMEFVYEGGGLGKAGTATLYVDGKKVGEGRIDRTHAFLFSMDETMDVGRDVGGSVFEGL